MFSLGTLPLDTEAGVYWQGNHTMLLLDWVIDLIDMRVELIRAIFRQCPGNSWLTLAR